MSFINFTVDHFERSSCGVISLSTATDVYPMSTIVAEDGSIELCPTVHDWARTSVSICPNASLEQTRDDLRRIADMLDAHHEHLRRFAKATANACGEGEIAFKTRKDMGFIG